LVTGWYLVGVGERNLLLISTAGSNAKGLQQQIYKMFEMKRSLTFYISISTVYYCSCA